MTRPPSRLSSPDILAPITAKPVWKGPSIALALGGGGAKGLAHIVVLEALDELGIRPTAIAGTSIGAVIGAAYAAGYSGAAWRRHVLKHFANRTQVLAKLLEARVGRWGDFFTGLGNPVLLDAEKLLTHFWPTPMPARFEDLSIPFTALSGDLLSRMEVRANSGDLASAVAGSMAIPGLIRAPMRDGHLLVDGYTVNPVPVDVLGGRADLVLAVDLGAAESRLMVEAPQNAYEALMHSVLLMQHSLTQAKFLQTPPDIRIIPDVGTVGVLDFLKAPAILQSLEGLREEVKRRILLRASMF